MTRDASLTLFFAASPFVFRQDDDDDAALAFAGHSLGKSDSVLADARTHTRSISSNN